MPLCDLLPLPFKCSSSLHLTTWWRTSILFAPYKRSGSPKSDKETVGMGSLKRETTLQGSQSACMLLRPIVTHPNKQEGSEFPSLEATKQRLDPHLRNKQKRGFLHWEIAERGKRLGQMIYFKDLGLAISLQKPSMQMYS